jgi:RNA polymerase sigma-70 factor (ECF subfamily)
MNATQETALAAATDEEIIREVLGGRKRAFEVIMRKYNQRLYRISMSIVGDSEEAEDILQAGYLNAYEHLAEFSFRSGFGTWLTKIVINESLQTLRKRKRLTEFDVEAEESPSDTQSPLQNKMNTELRTMLEEALTELPEKYRLVFMMREVEDMSIGETMECLSLTESNVKIRLSRAKEMLRDSLTGRYRTEELYGFHLTRCDRVVRNVLNYIESH